MKFFVNLLLLVTISVQFSIIFAEICHEKCDLSNLQLISESRNNVSIAKVNFNMCNSSAYLIKLSVDEDLLISDCENANSDINWKDHSKTNFSVAYNTALPQCGQIAEVELPYIYNGCYKVDIQGERNENASIVKFLTSNYTKEYVNIDAQGDYNNNEKSYFFVFTINNSFINEEIELNFKLFNENNSEITAAWHIECPLNSVSDKKCTFKDDRITNVTCNRMPTDVPKISCKLRNVEKGDYKMHVEILNDTRCQGQIGSTWNTHDSHSNPCLFIIDDIKAVSSLVIIDAPIDASKSSTIWIIVILALTLIVLCVIVIIYIRRRSAYSAENNTPYRYNSVNSKVNENFDIFLVYARDCEVVMETMAALKEVLQEFTSSNVYDIYDPSTSQELSISPSDWLLSRFSRPGRRLKTLLLASHVGDIQLQNPTVIYRRPRFYDNLFRLAVRVIEDNSQCSKYDSLFVLNFSGDDRASEYESFVSFTPGRRFSLPDNLQALLLQMGCDCKQENAESVVRFREKCADMGRFFEDRRDYVRDVLNVEVEEE